MAAAGIRIGLIAEVMASLFVTKLRRRKGKAENETTVTKYDDLLAEVAVRNRHPRAPIPAQTI